MFFPEEGFSVFSYILSKPQYFFKISVRNFLGIVWIYFQRVWTPFGRIFSTYSLLWVRSNFQALSRIRSLLQCVAIMQSAHKYMRKLVNSGDLNSSDSLRYLLKIGDHINEHLGKLSMRWTYMSFFLEAGVFYLAGWFSSRLVDLLKCVEYYIKNVRWHSCKFQLFMFVSFREVNKL